MDVRRELRRLLDVLSDYECEHLHAVIRDVSDGERFWETEIATLYNEYVKTRAFKRGDAELVPGPPQSEHGIFAPIPIVKSYPGAERVALPAAAELGAGITATVMNRRSRRDYTGGAISGVQLSTLLMHACGTTGSTEGYGYRRLPLRSFPSSGGLQAPEVYVSVQAVQGVAPGIYHYHPVDHALEIMRPGDHRGMLAALSFGQAFVERAAIVLIVTGYMARLRWKYGERAYRYMCMDVGGVGQNLYLAGEALGLGVCAIAGFVDDAIERVVGVDGRDEMALMLAAVGVRDSGDAPPT